MVISYWNGRSVRPLHRLLSQIRKVDSGSLFDLVIVCNGGDQTPLKLPQKFDDLQARIFNRENKGFNIGAWEHGWRNAGDYQYFLFIQDDCFLKRRLWLAEFENRFARDQGIGLLGEQIMYDQMSWDYIKASTVAYPVDSQESWSSDYHPVDKYKSLMKSRGIPCGATASHLPSIILFSSREVLEKIGGFPYFGPSYRQAIASELSISKLVEAQGFRIAKVTDRTFELIGHPQWAPNGKNRVPGFRGFLSELLWKSRTRLSLFLGNKNRTQKFGRAPQTHLNT